jgi:hypothetical protein
VEFTKADFSPSLFIGKKTGSQNWTVVLTVGTWIEGRVLSPEGKPVEDAPVEASRGRFPSHDSEIRSLSNTTRTDRLGQFRLNLEPYKYDIRVRVAGVGVCRLAKLRIAAKEKKQIDLRLARGADFHAVVRDSTTGKPVPGVALHCFEQPDVKGSSDENGDIRISDLFEGEYQFWLSGLGETNQNGRRDGYARWWSPAAIRKEQQGVFEDEFGFQRNFDDLTFSLSRGDVDTEILVEPAAILSGRVVDPVGRIVAGATVSVAATATGSSLSEDRRFSVRSDQMGRFTIKLPANKGVPYSLVAHDGTYGTWRSWANGVSKPPLTLPGQRLAGLELRLTQPGTVTGRVVSVAGRPRPNVKVRAISFDPNDDQHFVPITATDKDGKFVLRFVTAGKQYVQMAPFRPIIDDGSEFASETTVRVVNVEPQRTVSDIELRSR